MLDLPHLTGQSAKSPKKLFYFLIQKLKFLKTFILKTGSLSR
jgi:hypothetical protein